jgi:predicted nuclease of restriction endonuclease-like (RecB) superfamily/REP element-mobilizing transposase RayT
VSKKKPVTRKSTVAKSAKAVVQVDLLTDLRSLIDQARDATARAVNTALVLLYGSIGDRIRRDILKQKRAEYGREILVTLSQELVADYGNGFSVANLSRMMSLAELFSDSEIVVTLSRQLGWSHFVAIIPIKDDLKREFYAEMCRVERWSVRTLRAKLGGMLYERTAISKKPAQLAKEELAKLRTEDQLSPDMVFRDPYFLDFLGLKDSFGEKDLEAGILREIESFILELGGGCFSSPEGTHRLAGGRTYLSLHYHIVFSTKHRQPSILGAWRSELHKYLGGTVSGLGGFPQGCGGVADHVHPLVGLKATHCLADFVRELKKSATEWVRENHGDPEFAWQEGYAAFTVSGSLRKRIQGYIRDQEEHHRVKTFREELIEMLNKSGVDFDLKYLD